MHSTSELTRSVTNSYVRAFEERDTYTICSWVTNAAQLEMVSEDDGECLTPQILRSWLARSMASFVLIDGAGNEPVGFCTLSRCEAVGLAPDYVEMCHVVVNPQYKYAFVASRLLEAAKELAQSFRYRFGCCRVVPTNRWALALARYHRAEEFTGRETWAVTGFRWFRLDLTE